MNAVLLFRLNPQSMLHMSFGFELENAYGIFRGTSRRVALPIRSTAPKSIPPLHWLTHSKFASVLAVEFTIFTSLAASLAHAYSYGLVHT
jgi:hypothetical protein